MKDKTRDRAPAFKERKLPGSGRAVQQVRDAGAEKPARGLHLVPHPYIGDRGSQGTSRRAFAGPVLRPP